MKLIKLHIEHSHIKANVPINAPTKFVSSSIDMSIDSETWITFSLCLQQFCKGSGIPIELSYNYNSAQASHNLMLKFNPGIINCSPEILLEELKRFANTNTNYKLDTN